MQIPQRSCGSYIRGPFGIAAPPFLDYAHHACRGPFPPPYHLSSACLQKHVLHGILCIACLCFCFCLVLFTVLCVLLHATNTPQVHAACPGLWDFVLVAVFAPLLGPVCMLLSRSCCLSFSLVSWLSVLSALGVILSLRASLLSACIETLRDTTPPLPWLLLVSWAKTILFLSALFRAVRPGCTPLHAAPGLS